MKKRAACIAAVGILALGVGWAIVGGVASDLAAKAVKEFYAELSRDGQEARLESYAPLPKASVHYLAQEYSGYLDWQVFRTVVKVSDRNGFKVHNWRTAVVQDANAEWKVAAYGSGL